VAGASYSSVPSSSAATDGGSDGPSGSKMIFNAARGPGSSSGPTACVGGIMSVIVPSFGFEDFLGSLSWSAVGRRGMKHGHRMSFHAVEPVRFASVVAAPPEAILSWRRVPTSMP